MGKVPLDLRVDASVAAAGGFFLRGRAGHGNRRGIQPVALIVLADHHIFVAAFGQDIVALAAELLRCKAPVCKRGVLLHRHQQILASVEIVHHGQVVVFSAPVVGEIQLVAQYVAVRSCGSLAEIPVFLIVNALADDCLTLYLGLRICVSLPGCFAVLYAVQSCRIEDSELLLAGILIRPVCRQHAKGILGCGVNHKGIALPAGDRERFIFSLIQRPLALVLGVRRHGIARIPECFCRGHAGIGAAACHGDGIAVFRFCDGKRLLVRTEVAVAGGAVGCGLAVRSRHRLPCAKICIRYGNGQEIAVLLLKHFFHVFGGNIAVQAQIILNIIGIVRSRPHQRTGVLQLHGVGDVLAEIAAAIGLLVRLMVPCRRARLRSTDALSSLSAL